MPKGSNNARRPKGKYRPKGQPNVIITIRLSTAAYDHIDELSKKSGTRNIGWEIDKLILRDCNNNDKPA